MAPPEAVSVTPLPIQLVVGPVIAATGVAFIVTVFVAVDWQPAPFVIVTV